MDLLPPDPDALATRADLQMGLSDVRVEIAGVKSDLLEKMSEQTRLLMITMLTTTVTVVLAVVGAVVFAGGS